MGHSQRLLHLSSLFVAETQAVKVQRHRLPVQQPHHDTFAIHGRHGGNPYVQVLPLYTEIYPAILRQAPFGDIQSRHYFDTRNYSRAHFN